MAGVDSCQHCGQDLSTLERPRPRAGLPRLLMKTPVREVYPRAPLEITPGSPLRAAVERMQAHRQGCVLVVEDGSLQGILTERDLLNKVVGEERDLDDITVAEIMTANPLTLKGDDTLAFAMNRLSVGGYRHLPIRDNGELLGFLSIRCMLQYLAEQLV